MLVLKSILPSAPSIKGHVGIAIVNQEPATPQEAVVLLFKTTETLGWICRASSLAKADPAQGLQADSHTNMLKAGSKEARAIPFISSIQVQKRELLKIFKLASSQGR